MSQFSQGQLPSIVRNEFRIDEAAAMLRDSPYAELRHVTCRVEGDRCVLSGTVRSFYMKQLAQSLLLKQWGRALTVDNQLKVYFESEADS